MVTSLIMWIVCLLHILLLFHSCHALYSVGDGVIDLTTDNFQRNVIESDNIWLVEFYAPWCGHCKNLVPEYKKVAYALKGIIKVGAVDMTKHDSIGSLYNVRGFPTIKIFGENKKTPVDYNGARTASAICDAVLAEVEKLVSTRTGKGDRRYTGQGSGRGSGSSDVIELTDANFKKLVINSKDPWLVEFFAPWCGHCKNLEPHWKAAASQLKGKIKVGAVDATVNTALASEFGIRGFPTIKYFAPGSRESDAVDYEGGRTTSDIVNWATSKVLEDLPPPEVVQATSHEVVEKMCLEKQLCIFAFLPHILDCQSKCRNDYLATLRAIGNTFKRYGWGWVWLEGGVQPTLEESFDIGGIGYPAMVAVNYRKMKFAVLKGSFGKDGIQEFLQGLSYGKGQTVPIKGNEFPKITKTDAWDGKDAELPVEQDIDLSDVELDHTEL